MNDVLKIPFAAFNNNWDDLQLFLKHRGNPPYEITDDLNLSFSKIKSLGNLTSVGGYLDLYESKIEDFGNLTSVGGNLVMGCSKIEDFGNLTSVGGNLILRNTPLSEKYTREEIRSMIEIGGYIYPVTPFNLFLLSLRT
jgi:hypothetical protein